MTTGCLAQDQDAEPVGFEFDRPLTQDVGATSDNCRGLRLRCPRQCVWFRVSAALGRWATMPRRGRRATLSLGA